jgi:hypothetical protein
MYRFDDLLAVHLGGVHCRLNGFLSFDCKFVECHIFILLYFISNGLQDLRTFCGKAELTTF